MATYTKALLSGSTDGLAINITGTATSAVSLIHTANSSTSVLEEVYIYALNANATAADLTLEFGSSSSDSNIVENINGQIPKLVVPGFLLQGNATPKVVNAFAENSGVKIYGWVNRIDQS